MAEVVGAENCSSKRPRLQTAGRGNDDGVVDEDVEWAICRRAPSSQFFFIVVCPEMREARSENFLWRVQCFCVRFFW